MYKVKRGAGDPELIDEDQCTNDARIESILVAGIKSQHGDLSGDMDVRQR
jgi:hypothetical protein